MSSLSNSTPECEQTKMTVGINRDDDMSSNQSKAMKVIEDVIPADEANSTNVSSSHKSEDNFSDNDDDDLACTEVLSTHISSSEDLLPTTGQDISKIKPFIEKINSTQINATQSSITNSHTPALNKDYNYSSQHKSSDSSSNQMQSNTTTPKLIFSETNITKFKITSQKSDLNEKKSKKRTLQINANPVSQTMKKKYKPRQPRQIREQQQLPSLNDKMQYVSPQKIVASSQHLSYSWKSFGLGERTGTASWNRFLNCNNVNDTAEVTPHQALEIMSTFRHKTLPPLQHSKTYQYWRKIQGKNLEMNEYNTESMTTIKEHQNPLPNAIQPASTSIIHPPSTALFNIYEAMKPQEYQVNDKNGVVTSRDKMFYHTTASECKNMLRNMENDICAMKLQGDNLLKKGKELGFFDDDAISRNL